MQLVFILMEESYLIKKRKSSPLNLFQELTSSKLHFEEFSIYINILSKKEKKKKKCLLF